MATTNLNGSTTATFAVTLSVPLEKAVSVSWYTEDGTGKAGIDYEAAAGTVEFEPGETVKSIQVLVYGRDPDEADAGNRTFNIRLVPPSDVILGSALTECTIVVTDDEGTPVTTVQVATGPRGKQGEPGMSAYELAKLQGYEGTLEEWLDDIADATKAAARAEAARDETELLASQADENVRKATESAVIRTDQSADRAEKARDDAENIANANTYQITAEDPDGTIAGLAGTPNGESFRVGQGPGKGFKIYINSNGVAVEVGSSPGGDTLDILEKSKEYTDKSLSEVFGDMPSGSGAEAFHTSGYVSVSDPTGYPTTSTSAFSTSFIPVSKGDVVNANLVISQSAYAIAFFSDKNAASFLDGTAGTDNTKIATYGYRAPDNGYVVMSTAKTVVPSAIEDSSYSVRPEVVKRKDINSDIDVSIPSTSNLVENKVSDVYYGDEDATLTSPVTDNVYISAAGSMVSDNSHRLYAVSLIAGESVYAKVNFGSLSASSDRGIPILSRFISTGVFEPISFCFKAGDVYTDHLFTAESDCVVYVAAHISTASLPPVIRKRKYAIGDKKKQYVYSSNVFEDGSLHSVSNEGRRDNNANYMTTPLIPVKKGDVVKVKSAQNSSTVGSTLPMGVKYNAVGKFVSGALYFTYSSNTEYGYGVAEITEDGFIAVNNYTAGGLSSPEIVVFSNADALTYSVKAPAANPYGDIYPGLGFDLTGSMVPAAASVSYLFDRKMTPMDATISLSFYASAAQKYVAKLDADRNVLSVQTLNQGIVSVSLRDLFDSADVEFVGISHTATGFVDSTSMNLSVESHRGAGSLFELSEPVYNLYELAGRPDKTLAYDYTPLLQKLCLQMERQKRGKVYLESGVYKISGCYIKSHNHIYGDGMYNTIIAGADVPFKNEKLSNKVYEKITIENLGFNLDLLPQRAGRAINMEYVKDLVVRNVWIYKSLITGFGVDMIMSGVLENIVTEGCGQNKQDGSCAGMGIGVGAFLAGQEPIQVVNCINRNNFGHGMFFEWHNHRESSGETVIGDFPVGIQVVNCYSEGNAVGFGNAGGNGVSFVNCTAFRNLNGFAADHGSVRAGVRYGKNAVFSNCKAIENGSSHIQNPYFTPRQMIYGNGNGFAVYKTANYSDPEIGDDARGYYLDNCISENNDAYGMRISSAANVNTPVKDVQINGGSFSRNTGSGIQVSAPTENLFIRGVLAVENTQNGIGIGAQIIDGIIKDNIVKANAKGITAGGTSLVTSTIVKDNIVKGNDLDLENVINS